MISFKPFAILLFFMIFLSSCGKDTLSTPKKPTLRFENNTGADEIVKPNGEFSLTLTGVKGEASLKSMEFTEDGTPLSADRIKSNGSIVSTNPMNLIAPATEGFAIDFLVRASNVASSKIYTVVLTDVNNNTSSISKNVRVQSSTPLLTYAGPATINVQAGTIQEIKISGTGLIESIDVKENGAFMNKSRLKIGTLNFTANPFLLPVQLQNGFTNESLFITAPSGIGTYEYSITLKNSEGSSNIVKITFSIGTPIFGKTNGTLYQSFWFDCDDALEVSVNNVLAEIKDEGIDATKPDATNWKQQISGTNGSEVKYIKPGNGVHVAFLASDVVYKEEMLALWNIGVPFTKTNALGEKVSDKLAVDDILIVKNGSKFYLVEVKQIIITTAANDNNDKYVFLVVR